MVRMIFPLILPVAALGLAACSGGSSVNRGPTIPADEELTRVFSEGTGDVGDVISNDDTLTARSVGVTGIELNYDNDTTTLLPTTAAIRRNASGELTVTLNGVDHVFAPGDRVVEPGGEVFGYVVDNSGAGEYYDTFSNSGEIDQFLTPGNGYAEVLGIYSHRDFNLPATQAFAIFGTETRDEDLAALPTATYNGRARVHVYPQTGFDNSSTTRTVYRGNVEMTADFGAGSISGSMTNLTQRFGNGTDDPIAGSIAMNPAPFQANAYQGTLTPDATFSTAADIGSLNVGYSGAFYGPAAEETAGAISGTGTTTGGDGFNATGVFMADQY